MTSDTVLRCSRTRLPIPGTYTQRIVQVTDTTRDQQPPDYVTRLHTTGAGVYCSDLCAALHLIESLVIDGEVDSEAADTLADGRESECERADQARRDAARGIPTEAF